MNNKQLAALYIELISMYQEEFGAACQIEPAISQQSIMIEKIKMGTLSKQEIDMVEPIFVYGHIDIHRYVEPKKRFIWF